MLPENHREVVEVIMVSASRFRGMAASELGSMDYIEDILNDVMPFLFGGGFDSSVIIDACGKYLRQDSPQPISFYNIITAAHREPALVFMCEHYQGLNIPSPDIKWLAE